MVQDTEEWCKIWRKTDLWFGKFGKFSSEHSKVPKLVDWWDPFTQSRKYMSLNFTELLCIMAMKNDAKFEEELICRFKIYAKVLRILTWALKCLKKLHFNGPL